ncbi:hypothetical protein IFR05_015919 [Cadophora sp. M221]|nr:hypothetical protein IFR05_015919 [Cadophora sp. M221]
MLDPLTAFSLAGTVMEFIDFGCKIISTTRELSQSRNGASEEVNNHEVITRDLLSLSEKLEASVEECFVDGVSYTGSDEALKKLCEGCDSLSKKMLKRLDKLKIQDGAGKRATLKQAIKTLWSHNELSEIAAQLASYQRQMEIHVLIAFNQIDFANVTRERFDLAILQQDSRCSDDVSQKIVAGLLENTRVYDSTIDAQTLEITALHYDTRSLVIREHERTQMEVLAAVERMSPGIVHPNNSENIYQRHDLLQRAQDRILRSLQFPSICECYEQVPYAHAATFNWIFENPNDEDRPWSNFSDWLQSGDGIYRINGKAGSGKSTLMKYLYGHSRMLELLKPWSGPLALHVAANFFFSSSGTSEQKSLVGLLRSLLYELLSKHKDLISIVLHQQWMEENTGSRSEPGDRRWNLDKLVEVFHKFRSLSGLKICLFVDGLDEYECPDKNHAEITSFFADLAKSPDIKICLSSRPWLVFEDAFRSAPSLRLQYLTSRDITRYVDDKINRHDRMADLRRISPEDAESLVEEIVAKASGVFLWVTLVVKSLLNGFTNRDRIADLLERLRALPPYLEGFYEHMLLNHIRPIYKDQASRIFQIMSVCKTDGDGYDSLKLPLLVLRLSEGRGQLSGQTLIVRSWSKSKIMFEQDEMAARLKSRCAGLLEVSQEVGGNFGPNVSFLHRTVKDFLSILTTQQLLKTWAPRDFDAPNCLLKAYILSLRTAAANVNDDDFGPIYYRARDAMTIAHRARNSGYGLNNQLVDALDETTTGHWHLIPIANNTSGRAIDQHWAEWGVGLKDGREYDDFLGKAIAYGLLNYVAAKILEDDQVVVRKTGRPYLEYVFTNKHDIAIQLEMIIVLLRGGANPNQMYEGRTIWNYILERMCEEENRPGSILIRHGPPDFHPRSNGCPLAEPWISTLKMLV